MIPSKVFAHFYGPYPFLEWDIPDGITAIMGRNETSEGASSNGAGKTKLLELIPLSLFGPNGSWSDHLMLDSDEICTIGMEFEHQGDIYKVTRSYDPRGRGRTTLDFAIQGESWESLTMETQAATQAKIEQIIGVTESTFSHAAFAAQGAQHFADPDITPKERKEILADALGLGVWETLLEKVRTDMKALRDELVRLDYEASGLMSQIEELQDEQEAHDALAVTLAVQREDEHTLATQLALVEGEWQACQMAATLRAELATLVEVRLNLEAVDRAAVGAVDELANMSRRTAMLVAHVEDIPVWEEMQEQRREWEAAGAQMERLEAEIELIQAKIGEMPKADHCELCLQVLDSAARAATLEALHEQLDDAQERGRLLAESGPSEPIYDAEYIQSQLDGARNAERELAAQMEREAILRGLAASAASDEFADSLQEAKDQETAKEEELTALGVPDELPLEKLNIDRLALAGNLAALRSTLLRTETGLAVSAERLERLARLTERHAEAEKASDGLQGRLNVLQALERAYGRDGIPALILESAAIPQIESEAARVLEAMGVPFRVELQTQRETKTTGTLKDTLEVLVHEPNGTRGYGTYSGGEQTRIELALRIGLARLLAHRRGADLGLLALDEMPFLDAAGQLALVGVLRSLGSEFPRILVISHDPLLADTLGQSVTVVRDAAGVARITD